MSPDWSSYVELCAMEERTASVTQGHRLIMTFVCSKRAHAVRAEGGRQMLLGPADVLTVDKAAEVLKLLVHTQVHGASIAAPEEEGRNPINHAPSLRSSEPNLTTKKPCTLHPQVGMFPLMLSQSLIGIITPTKDC